MRKNIGAIVALLALAIGVGGWTAWTWSERGRLPPGLISANGRVEVTRVDVATKLPGRVAEMRVKEGDMVEKGEIVAVLDAADLLAQRAAARAAVVRAGQGIAKAEADVASAEANLTLAEVQLRRATDLLDKAVSSQAQQDQAKAQRDVAAATVRAALAAVADAVAARDAAQAQVDLIQVNIDDTKLVAPIAGRVEYRLIEPGAVIGAGSKVATLLDLTDVEMTVFLPTRFAGRVEVGAPARIVLDAAPQWVIPAAVSFVAAEAQFTPKSVETADERAKLMYRVKVRVDPGLAAQWRAYVKSGLTGDAWLATEPQAVWPERLAVRLPDPAEAKK
ncbi:MAG: HlyD family efflux transporter periplasmic adaptor subunit [Hyphomicrobiales bacterium]|nr:HlyD family efflux transporter periplasmic adaptor subunit [Hyphomicrobiales bacterium]